MVRFSNLEKTQHWYTSFAWLLMEGQHYEEALVHFNRAIEIDNNSWKALQGRSKCLLRQKNYEEAVKTLSEALALVPKHMPFAESKLKSDLTKILLAKGDFNAALDQALDMYSSRKTDRNAISRCIQALYGLHDYNRIVEIIQDLRHIEALRKLEARSPSWKPLNFIDLRDVHYEIGCALRITGKLDLVRSWVVACSPINISPFPRLFRASPWLAAWIAEFTYAFYTEPEESMAMCEYILSAGFKSALGPELTWAYSYPSSSATRLLSHLYFDNALSAHKSGGDSETWISKLREFAISKAKRDEKLRYELNGASLLLGIFLRLYRNADEVTWRPCFRGLILEAIDQLSGGDSMKHIYAYSQLIKALMAAGNITAAVEGLAVVLKPLEAISNPELVKSFESIGFEASHYRCGGPCNTQFHVYKELYYKELYFCENCINTCFCEDCFPIAKRGELPYRGCSPEHTYIKVFPIPEEARDVAARFVDGKMEVQKGWLETLRKEWL
jgi:tetratricopeptide (TPR) repeat protein